MAKVKFSALVSEMRNKLNGSVFSKNRGGNYLRNKVTPVNPQTVAQLNVRGIFASLSSAFRSLGQSVIAAWNAASANFPVIDIFGDTKFLSGQQLYIRLNANLAQVGVAALVDPPSPGIAPTPGVTGLAVVATPQTFEVNFTETVAPAGMSLVIWATPGLSPGKTFVKNLFRSLGSFTLAAGEVDIISEYTNRFGPLVAGQKVFIKAVYINTATGQQSVPITASDIVVAVP